MISTRSNILIGTWIVLASLGGCGTPPRDGSEKISPTTNDVAGPAGLTLTTIVYDVLDPVVQDSTGASTTFDDLIAKMSFDGTTPTESTVKSWQADGLRIGVVPAREAQELVSRLRPARPILRLQLFELLTPTPIVRGIETDHDIRIARAEEILAFPPGTLQLVARAYAVPGLLRADGTPSKQLRLDLSVQHFDPVLSLDRMVSRFSISEDSDTPRGSSIASLESEVDLQSGSVLIVYALERPEADPAVQLEGPPVPPLPTVGEGLLTDFTTLPRSRLRTLIVLEPQILIDPD